MTLLEGVPLGVFITVLLIGLLFFFAWNRLLRREINERVQAEDALRREISERAQAEAALRASEERFRDFAETAADWFWEKDEDLKFMYLSERFQESTGWTPEKVLGRTLAQCFSTPQADQEKWQRHFEDLAGRRPYKNFESRWLRLDGSLAVLSTSGKPMFDENGKFKGYRGVGRDITKRKKAEETLRKLSRTVDQSPNMVFITDTNGNIEYVNPGFCRISGYSAREACGRNARILKSGKTPKAVYEDLWQTVKQGKIWRGELRNKNKAGELFWNFVSISPIVDDDGKITHFGSIQIDVTELKRTEQALRESEARLRAIANAVPDLLFLLDSDGRYVEILSSQQHLLHADANALIGRRVSEVLPERVSTRLLSAVRQTLATGRTQVIEYEVEVPSTQRHYFEARTAPIGKNWFEARTAPIESPDTSKPAVIIVARDVTERKAAEDQLRQAQKMEAVGHLTGGIAHDFNNLLAIVLGNLELLLEQLEDRDDLADLVHRALEAGERGATLTRHLLAFSRRQPLQPRPLDLNALVARMTDLLKRTLGETIQVETRLADNLWNTLADPTQLENALLNLAVNARDAMPKGGTLTIATANSRLDARYTAAQQDVRPGEYVMLTVGDTGAGMTDEIANNAFQPFFTTKGVGKGTGLGLSMVYGLVKQLGGHVEIDSQVGRGTTVKLFLARTEAATERPRESAPAVDNSEKPKARTELILVVEDDANVRELAVSMLNNLGYRTLEAEHAEAALSLLRDNPKIDLLFTDVVLPGGMSGGDLARRVRIEKPNLRILFTSGYTKHALVNRGRLDGGVDLLAKPYRKASLAEKLDEVLAHGKTT